MESAKAECYKDPMSLETKLSGGLLASLCLVALLGAVAYWSASRFTASVDWVRHTHQVIEVMDEAEGYLHRAEAQQRDYLLTADRNFLSAKFTISPQTRLARSRSRRRTGSAAGS